MSRQRSMEKILEDKYVTVGELVRITDVRYSTIKYYTEDGLLPFIQEEEKLVRKYDREESVKTLNYIKKLREMGYSIKEIKAIIKNENNKDININDIYRKIIPKEEELCIEEEVLSEEELKIKEIEKVKAIEIAKNLLDVLDVKIIAEKTGLSIEEVEKLK